MQVTTLLSKAEEAASTPEVSEDTLVDMDTLVSQQGSAVKAAKEVQPGSAHTAALRNEGRA